MIAQAGLSLGHLASGPSKAVAGAARQTASSRADRRRAKAGAKDARTRRLAGSLRTTRRGDYELETDDSAANAGH